MHKRFFLLVATCACLSAVAQYPGKELPGDKPAIFARGLVSDGMNNRDFTISPDGNEIFYSVQQRDFSISTILRLYKKNNKWVGPEVASFSGQYKDLEAVFSPDGNKIYYVSDRPSTATDTTDDFDIWYVNKEPNGWSAPVHAGFVINSPKNEFYPSVARNGNIYFTAEVPNNKEDIVMCEFKNGQYSPPVSLPEPVNSANFEYNAFVDPDEQFILFCAEGRPGGLGCADIYQSKKDANGKWQAAKHLDINTRFQDYCPYVTPDKKIFFFSSNRSINKSPLGAGVNYKQLSAILTGAGNGMDDIYWMNWKPD